MLVSRQHGLRHTGREGRLQLRGIALLTMLNTHLIAGSDRRVDVHIEGRGAGNFKGHTTGAVDYKDWVCESGEDSPVRTAVQNRTSASLVKVAQVKQDIRDIRVDMDGTRICVESVME